MTTTSIHPGTAQLLKATAAAVAVAALLLVIAVLPAEYGFDPTGIGARLGLTALAAPPAEAPSADTIQTPVMVEPAPAVAAPVAEAPPGETQAPGAVARADAPFREATLSLTLAPGKGGEIKTKIRAGDTIVFSWVSAGGPVNFDMHGEKPDDGDRYTSYWKDRGKDSGHGSFVAPFDGSHGWFWRNRGTVPVTVTVKVSGYFEGLAQPHSH